MMKKILASMTLLGALAVSSAFAAPGDSVAVPIAGGAAGNWLVNITQSAGQYLVTVTPDVGANVPNHTVNTLQVTLLDCAGNAAQVAGSGIGTIGGIVTAGNAGPTGAWLTPPTNQNLYSSQEKQPLQVTDGGPLGTVGSAFNGTAVLVNPAQPVQQYSLTFLADSPFVVNGSSGALWGNAAPAAIGNPIACPQAGVPEPGTLALLIPGLAPFGFMLRRRRNLGS